MQCNVCNKKRRTFAKNSSKYICSDFQCTQEIVESCIDTHFIGQATRISLTLLSYSLGSNLNEKLWGEK